jgi:Fe-S cluster biogenesis protein NfuA
MVAAHLLSYNVKELEGSLPTFQQAVAMKGRRTINFEEVQSVIQRVRPALQFEGGEIELIEVTGRNACVSLRGGFTSCASSTLLLKFGIERALREAIPDFGELIAEIPSEAAVAL